MPSKKPERPPEPPARLVGPGPGGQGAAKWVVTEPGLKLVEDLAARGLHLDTIASTLGMHPATFRLVRQRQPEVQWALERGLAKEHDFLVGKLHELAKKGNVVAILFALKARFGYREGVATEVNVNVNTGGVLVVPERESVEQYLERLRIAAEDEAPGPLIDVTPVDPHPTGTRLARGD